MKSSFWPKLIVFTVSLVFFLCLLEVGLRVAGHVMFGRNQRRTETVIPAGARILCVGDSFTHGGVVSEENSYPAQLEKLLAARIPSRRFSVINEGVCESNTKMLLDRLPGWLDEYKPEMVILLVGSANRFHPPAREELGESLWSVSRSRNFLSDLRVAKMARILWVNLKGAAAGRGGLGEVIRNVTPDPWKDVERSRGPRSSYRVDVQDWKERAVRPRPRDPLLMLWHFDVTGEYQKGIASAKKLLENGGGDELEISLALTDLYLSSGKIADAERLLDALRAKFPDSQKVYNARAYYYREFAEWNRMKSRFQTAIAYYLKAIELDPSKNYNYYWMTKLYDMQSYYDSEKIRGELKGMLERNPALAENEMFNVYQKLYADKQGWEKGIERWIFNDLDSIVELCRERGIALVVQNYPIPYAAANRQLRKVAEKHSLTFVDNEATFSGLRPREKFIYDDDHCTLDGHRVMVDNIFKALIEKGLVKQ